MKASASPAHVTHATQRYLTFRLAGEIYGVRVLGVQEIIRLPPITHVPQLPPHVRGVFNLRGRIIPVIDMRQRFSLPRTDDQARACVVVVHVETARSVALHMGLVVDGVEDVLQIAPDDIAPTPEFGCQVDTAFLLGIAKVKGAVTALLDLDRVLTGDQIEKLPRSAAAVL